VSVYGSEDDYLDPFEDWDTFLQFLRAPPPFSRTRAVHEDKAIRSSIFDYLADLWNPDLRERYPGILPHEKDEVKRLAAISTPLPEPDQIEALNWVRRSPPPLPPRPATPRTPTRRTHRRSVSSPEVIPLRLPRLASRGELSHTTSGPTQLGAFPESPVPSRSASPTRHNHPQVQDESDVSPLGINDPTQYDQSKPEASRLKAIERLAGLVNPSSWHGKRVPKLAAAAAADPAAKRPSFLASGYWPEHPRPKPRSPRSRKMWQILFLWTIAVMTPVASAFQWGDTFRTLYDTMGFQPERDNTAWYPLVYGLTTLVAIQGLRKAWNDHSPPDQPTKPNEVASLYGWAKQAEVALGMAERDVQTLTKQLKQAKEEAAQGNTAPLVNTVQGILNAKECLRKLPPSPQKRRIQELLDALAASARDGKDHDTRLPPDPDPEDVLPYETPDIFNHISDRSIPHAEYRNKSMDWEPEHPHKFPNHPPQPPQDRDSFITIDPPFIYDGTVEKWTQWYTACTLYFGGEQNRFRNRAEVPYIILNRVQAGTHAAIFLQSLCMRILKQGSMENVMFNQTLEGSFNCAQWILKSLKEICWTKEYEGKMRAILHTPLGQKRYDHWIISIEDAMQQLDLPVAHVLPIVIQNLSAEITYNFCLAWSKSPDQFTWEELYQKGPEVATRLFLRNKEHHAHSRSQHAAPRTTSSIPRSNSPPSSPPSAPPHKAANPISCLKRWDDSPPVPAWLRGQLTDKTREYCRKNNLCFRCRRPTADHKGGKFPGSTSSSVTSRVSTAIVDDPCFGPGLEQDQ
jgi:hypothetical protein